MISVSGFVRLRSPGSRSQILAKTCDLLTDDEKVTKKAFPVIPTVKYCEHSQMITELQ